MKRLKWVLIFLFCPLVVFGGDVKTLSLEEAIQMALANNRTLKVAQNRVQISQVGVKDARSAFLPHLTAGASYTRLDEAPYIDASQFGQMFEPLMAPFADLVMQGYLNPSTLAGLQNIGIDRIYMGKEDNYTINVSLEQPLFTGGTILNAYRIARLSSEVEEWNYRRDEDRIRYDVTEAFSGLIKARELLVVTRESIQRTQVHLTDLENLYAGGMVLQRDLLSARVALSNVKLLNVRAQNAVKLAMSYLSHLLSLDLDTEIIPREIPDSRSDSLDALEGYVTHALEMRPEIKAINTNHTITEKLISIRKGEFLPKLFLAGNYDCKRPNREIEPKFYDSWNVTLALKLDLFHGGAKYYRLEQAKLALRQVEQNQHMLADGIALEVRQAYLAVEEAEQALAIAGETIAQAEESYRVARENFQAGTATNADVLDAQNDLMQAQMQRVTSHADLLVAQAKLTRATTGF